MIEVKRWRLTVKHSSGNHLGVVGRKGFKKRSFGNQSQAAGETGFVVGIRSAKEDVLVLHDVFEKCTIRYREFADVVVGEAREVVPMARLPIGVELWVGTIAGNVNQGSLLPKSPGRRENGNCCFRKLELGGVRRRCKAGAGALRWGRLRFVLRIRGRRFHPARSAMDME